MIFDTLLRRCEPAVGQPSEAEVDFDRLDCFIESTRTAIFIRPEDRLLLIRPDKTLSLNDSAVAILGALYTRDARPAREVLTDLAPKLGVAPDRLRADALSLVDAVGNLLNEDYSDNPVLVRGTFDRSIVQYPTLAEIALTYGCQNRCAFCYAASPERGDRGPVMTTDEVKFVMRRIIEQAHVPSLSFTGGEATLRPDLGVLVAYGAELGFRVNLITNGVKLACADYTAALVEAGLDSAQVSLEAGDEALHDEIVGRPGAFRATVAGVRNLRKSGIHVHTNSTLCPGNREAVKDLISFVGEELGLATMSMNMVIRTGLAQAGSGMEINYAEVAQLIPEMLETASGCGVKLVWYSPIPYCLFNPVLHGLGAKSCACVDGILSIDPGGNVLPCSSFEGGLGSLLEQDFADIHDSEAALYWRNKMFVPPVCRQCPDVDVCAGGCPLYWDQASGFGELPRDGAFDEGARRVWEAEREAGLCFGTRRR